MRRRVPRSAVVTAKLEPQLRYGLELAARKHRRTSSSYIECYLQPLDFHDFAPTSTLN